MVWWPFIVLAILLFLLFYPLTLRAEVFYDKDQWWGMVTLHPLLGLKKPAIRLWDSERPPKEKKDRAKKPKKAKKAGESNTAKKDQEKLPPQDIILAFVDLIKEAKERVKWLRVNLILRYALPDPAAMGYLTGAIYSVVPIVMGDQRKSRWRLRIYPDWQYFATMVYCKAKITICIFDIFYAFGGILIKALKLLLPIIRRK